MSVRPGPMLARTTVVKFFDIRQQRHSRASAETPTLKPHLEKSKIVMAALSRLPVERARVGDHGIEEAAPQDSSRFEPTPRPDESMTLTQRLDAIRSRVVPLRHGESGELAELPEISNAVGSRKPPSAVDPEQTFCDCREFYDRYPPCCAAPNSRFRPALRYDWKGATAKLQTCVAANAMFGPAVILLNDLKLLLPLADDPPLALPSERGYPLLHSTLPQQAHPHRLAERR